MAKPERSKLIRNISSNLLGALIPIAVTLFTVPIYLSHIGASRYGVVLVAWSLLGYFGFMDLGISRATTNALSKMADGDGRGAKHRVFWSSFIINGCMGLIGGLILYVCGSYLFLHVMKVAPEVRGEIAGSIGYLAAMLPMALMLGVGVGTVEAHEKFVTLNIIQTTGMILGQVLPLAAVMHWGPSLEVIMPVMLVVRAFTFCSVMLYAIKVSGVSLKPVVDIPLLKSLFAFGGWVTVTNVISPIMTDVDQFVIGSLRNVAVIPFYSVPMNIVQRSQILPTMLTRTLFPVFSRLNRDDSRDIVSVTLCHLGTIVSLVYIAAIFLCGQFLNIWLGPEMMARGGPVFRLLAMGAWWNSLAFVLFSAIQGQGRPRAVATIHMSEVLPYVGLMLLLVHFYGVTGAAVAWMIRVTIDAMLLAAVHKVDRPVLAALAPGLACMIVSFAAVTLLDLGLIGSIVGCIVMWAVFLVLNATTNRPFRDVLVSFRRSGFRLRPVDVPQ
ncbi:flippase [Sphingomonas sp. CGMCC 1.13654]|uniref:Flippase n=1 Tax=Sphingomonas chungangi TaxID=2683589 RepID=A0A838LAU1_9SPHN|nr:flippase [Sphingomonas chungangi]MVW55342.1 oligosaccharide flippase family protein [Sphingomonas chungangi]